MRTKARDHKVAAELNLLEKTFQHATSKAKRTFGMDFLVRIPLKQKALVLLKLKKLALCEQGFSAIIIDDL